MRIKCRPMKEQVILHIKFSLKMLYPVERRTERCASKNLSSDNENLVLAAAFCTPISSFRERPYSHEGNKHAALLVT